MNEIIRIQLYNDYYKSDENIKVINEIYLNIISMAVELNIWEDAIQEIIITDEFKKEIERQALEWQISSSISQDKGNSVVSKILFNRDINHPQYKIFFHVKNLFNRKIPVLPVALGQIMNIHAKKIVPSSLRKNEYKFDLNTLDDYISFASVDWCKAVHTRLTLNQILMDPILAIDQNTFLTAFKRQLKKNLYEYNSHLNVGVLWNNYFNSICTLFLRVAENYVSNNEQPISEREPCRKLIYTVIDEIVDLTKNWVDNKEYDFNKLKIAVKKFTAYFEIFLENESNINFKIRLTKNPKDYFTEELIETEPRIVCFMDILGFSEYINQYDLDPTSTTLQDIKESFDLAKKNLLDHKTPQNSEAIKHLKYQTFSNNICISIPFFDNENDFLSNLNILVSYVRGFQSIMMEKGFFTRGGISMGSYYADNNIIFSKALVNAYLLESKKAIYPRIIFDQNIIDKLYNYDYQRIRHFGLHNIILFDCENIAFLNPFMFFNSVSERFKAILREVDTEKKGEDNGLDLMTKSVDNITTEIFKRIADEEIQNIEEITKKIKKNILVYANNENIVSKYLWLIEVIKWVQKDETGKLNFQFLYEKFEKLHK